MSSGTRTAEGFRVRRPDLESMTGLVDLPVEARISAPQTIGWGYRSYEKYEISLPETLGSSGIERDVLRSGAVGGILPIDISRKEVVLIRQFRLGSHLALGKGAMIEIPAGRVGAQETADQAARCECQEEVGVSPIQYVPCFKLCQLPRSATSA